MATAAKDASTRPKKPGIPRPSAIRQSLGHITKSSVSRALNDVIGKENTSNPSRSTLSSSNKTVTRDDDTTEFGKMSAKSPLGTTKPSQPKVDRQSPTPNGSPSASRKIHSHSASVPSVSTLKPRDSTGGETALPKYRPRGSLLPLKHTTITRKRKTLIDSVEEESASESAPEPRKISNRPISPLPRRSRVQSTVSDSSNLFEPKLTLKPIASQLKTPTKGRPSGSTHSTPSSVRVRTMSQVTTSSRLSVQKSPSVDSPVRRIEKRPRLSSESKPSPGASTLKSSTSTMRSTRSTMAADMSSDSIDIAEMSALLSVSPNISPAKGLAPTSVRRITVRRPANPSSGPTTPSRKTGVSTLPSRQNAANFLSPESAAQPRKPSARPSGLTSRKSILSWADFSDVKLPDDNTNLAEIAPLQGIVTPGSDDFHPRERVDSGWGLSDIGNNRFSAASTGLSIGQLMFPSIEASQPRLEDTKPPDGSAVVEKLLRVKLSAAEQEVAELKARVGAMERRLEGSSGTSTRTTSVVEVNIQTPKETEAINELSIQRLQNAELEAKTAFLEECLANTRDAMAAKNADLERSKRVIERLEEKYEEEKVQSELAVQAMMEELPVRVGRQVEEVVGKRVTASVNAVENRWVARLAYMLAVEQGAGRWRDVKTRAVNDLELVRRNMDTLKVLAAGVEALKLEVHAQ